MKTTQLLLTIFIATLLSGCSFFKQAEEGKEANQERERIARHLEDFNKPSAHVEEATKYASQNLRLSPDELKFIKKNPPEITKSADGSFVVYYWSLSTGEGLQVLAGSTGSLMVDARRGLSQPYFP